MITSREDFLMQVLHCGILDLKLIDGVGYDFCDILKLDSTFQFEINFVMAMVFEYGYSQIAQAVNDRICELEAIPNGRELEADEELELAELRTLEPYEDFAAYHNYIDTHVWCEKNKAIYKKYLSEALDDFAEGAGFEIIIE